MIFRTVVLWGIILVCTGCSDADESSAITYKKTESLELPAHLKDVENLTVLYDLKGAEEVSFTKFQTFGEIYPQLLPPQFGFGSDLAVDAKGFVYRADKGERIILVFNREGELVKKLGRDGRGPGEFQSIVALDVFEDKLVVYDSNLERISTFSTTNYELEDVLTINTSAWGDKVKAKFKKPQTVKIIESENFLISTLKEKEDGSVFQSYYQMNSEGQIISDEVLETESSKHHIGTTRQGSRAGIRLPFSPQGQIGISESGEIHHINTGEFLINRYDDQGTHLQAFYYPFEKASLNQEEFIKEQHYNMQTVYSDVDFPEAWPAFESLLVDDKNNTWISTIVNSKDSQKWYIIDESGEVKAAFFWPVESDVKAVRNGKMYAEEKDPESEAEVIVGYDITYKVLSP